MSVERKQLSGINRTYFYLEAFGGVSRRGIGRGDGGDSDGLVRLAGVEEAGLDAA